MTPSKPANRRIVLQGVAATAALTLGGVARALAGPRVPVPVLPDAICRVADSQAPALAAPAIAKPGTALKLTFNANSICTAGVPVALETGLFKKHGLDVELLSFGGSTDQLLEAISTGKADAGVGMALRWLKPLEQGFDVKIATAIHGGCMRLFTNKASGITTIAGLKGKTFGASDMGAPDKNFFSIVAAKQGLDPNTDITWRQFPADLLGAALARGDIQGFALSDPLAWVVRERDGLVEIANNLSGEYQHRACCVLGLRGSLVRNDRVAAAALTQALLEAQDVVSTDPLLAAGVFQKYAAVPKEQLAAMLASHTHNHHPQGPALKAELAAYVAELKLVGVIKPSTDPAKLAEKIFADVLSS